jgi:hypothetical protein
MKIIFLDVDGILNNDDTTSTYGMYVGWEKKCVDRLNQIIRKTGAAIVISSSWRLHRSMNEIIHLFNVKMGICGTILGSTPVQNVEERDAEIGAWMKFFKGKTGRDIKRFVILDDMDPLMFQDHWIETDTCAGLTNKQADQVVCRLNGDRKKISASCLLDTPDPCEDFFMSITSLPEEDILIFDFDLSGE